MSFLFGDEIISIELCKSSHHGEYLAGQSEVDSIVDRCRVAACVELVALRCFSAQTLERFQYVKSQPWMNVKQCLILLGWPYPNKIDDDLLA